MSGNPDMDWVLGKLRSTSVYCDIQSNIPLTDGYCNTAGTQALFNIKLMPQNVNQSCSWLGFLMRSVHGILHWCDMSLLLKYLSRSVASPGCLSGFWLHRNTSLVLWLRFMHTSSVIIKSSWMPSIKLGRCDRYIWMTYKILDKKVLRTIYRTIDFSLLFLSLN